MSVFSKGLAIKLGVGFLVLIVLPIVTLYPVSQYCSSPIQNSAERNASKSAGTGTHDPAENPQTADDHSPIIKFLKSLQQAQEAHYGAGKANAPRDDWGHAFLCDMKIGEFFIATFAYWLLIAFAGLIWTALRQERALAESIAVARRAADIADETLKRTERPQLLILFEARDFGPFRTDCLANTTTNSTTAPDLSFYLKNFGRQIAVLRKISINYGFFESAPAVATMRAPTNQVFTSQAKGDVIKCGFPKNWEFDREKINLMTDGKLFFWFASLVEYADGFGGEYETEILWRYSMHNENFFGLWQEGGRNRNT